MNYLLIFSLVGSAISQPSTRFGKLETRIPNTCSTITGSQCVFPFTYKSVEYYQCTYADSPTPWCATQVDSAGVVVTNKWGDCETGTLSSCQPETISLPSCTTESGPYPDQPCVFPFRYNGVTYTSCTTQDKSTAWCSTSTTLAGTHIPGYYGFCPSSCLAEQSTSCTPGTSYTVECNTCVCGADGQPVCTTTVCGASTTTTTTTTTTVAPSTSCTPGQVSTVDCNTCVCNSQGEAICTTNECTATTTTSPAPAGTCTTVGGPAQGSPCVFPFTFASTTYQSCTEWIYGGQPAGTLWCSTKVDEEGVHVNNEGNYGFCGEGCYSPRDIAGGEVFGEVFETNARSAVIFGRQRPN